MPPRKLGMMFSRRVETITRRIPRGHVATYGQVAALAGVPRAARMVGWVLRHTVVELPWQRVINREGRISIVHECLTPRIQADLLRREGVPIEEHDDAFWVDLKTRLWNPVRRAGVV